MLSIGEVGSVAGGNLRINRLLDDFREQIGLMQKMVDTSINSGTE